MSGKPYNGTKPILGCPIVVVAAHPLARVGYTFLLQKFLNCSVAAVQSHGLDVEVLLGEHPRALVILEIPTIVPGGLDQLRTIRNSSPLTRILAVSSLPETQHARAILRAGAHGYVRKESHVDELVLAAQTVMVGERYISGQLADFLVSDVDNNIDNAIARRLSDREFQVFTELAAGVTPSNIGRDLGLSVKTISTYRVRILSKLQFKSNAEMTILALRAGLLT